MTADYPITEHIVCCYYNDSGAGLTAALQSGLIREAPGLFCNKDSGAAKMYVIGKPSECAAIPGVSCIAWRPMPPLEA